MRELTMQELEEVAGGWEISFTGAVSCFAAGIAGGIASALGAGFILSAAVAAGVVLLIDNIDALIAAQNDLWALELEYARMTIS